MADLQLSEQEQRHQQQDRLRRIARGQRLGWLAFAVILTCALAGLAGPGPLSWANTSGPLVEVEYERFARFLGDTSLEATVRPDPATPGTARLWISDDYLRGLDVQRVTPEPDSWTAAEGGVVLAFPVTGGHAEVSIQISPDHVGTLRGAVGAPGHEPARFWQFIYP